jgi:hypothetical protein
VLPPVTGAGIRLLAAAPALLLATMLAACTPASTATDSRSAGLPAGGNERATTGSAGQGHSGSSGQSDEQFQPFGLSVDSFAWSAAGGQIAITPPLGADEYRALWGVSDGQRRCAVTVSLDSSLDDAQAVGNFGFAVAPLSSIQGDQPAGASAQYEHEAPPAFSAAGSFVRPAQLPGGAWHVAVTPVPAPDIAGRHQIRLTDNGTAMNLEIDGQNVATYPHPPECGGVAIRVWGAGFTFSNVTVSESAPGTTRPPADVARRAGAPRGTIQAVSAG